ncbi:hypothetical protein TNCV_3231331, partial [Trichonephila clavipes]
EPHPQMTGTLSYRPEETGGRQRKSPHDTGDWTTDIAFYRGQKIARWCCLHDALYGVTFNASPIGEGCSLWCREQRN